MSTNSPTPRRSNRHKLHDPDVLQRLTTGLKAGLYREEAAIGAGIGTSTFYRWMKEGQAHAEAETQAALDNLDNPEWEPDEPTRQRVIWEAVKEAEATAELAHVANVRQAAMSGAWQASAWWLERKMPQKWGRHDRVEHSGDVAVAGEPREVVPESEEQRLEIARILADAGALEEQEQE